MIGLSIRRPVAATMVYCTIALLGIFAWKNLPIELVPDTSFPQLSLTYAWPGASPETAEAFATAPLEAAVQMVQGVEKITSRTDEGRGTITVAFDRETDMDFARMELAELIRGVEEDLPDGVSGVQVTMYIPQEFQQQATSSLLTYTFTGPLLVEALRLHIDTEITPELLRIPGVADVQVSGGRLRQLEIEMDPGQIASLGVNSDQIARAIGGLEQIREAGAIRNGDREWVITLRSRPLNVQELRTAILPISGRDPQEAPIRLEEVAVVRDAFQDITTHNRINGSPAVTISIFKGEKVNTVALADSVKARMAALEAINPPGARVILSSDQSVDVRRELTDLGSRSLISAVVIFLVLLAFLRSFRTTAIVFATIVFSILIALNVVYFGGLSLNLFTLMGLALGFGLIVDNSIVVLENIHRRLEEGDDPIAASENGAKEVVLPILASTLTTLIVFLPFLYFQGELRIYYLPLAVVMALTQVASLFVSFTFIPALAARVMKPKVLTGVGGGERARPLYIRFYGGLLGHTLRHPWITTFVVAACLGGTYYLFDNHVTRGSGLGSGAGTQRSYINISLTMARGQDLSRLNSLAGLFEERLGRMPEVSQFTTRVSDRNATIRVEFPEELEYTAIPLVILERIGGFALGFTGVQVNVSGMGQYFSAGATGSTIANYRLTLLGYNYERLAEIAEDLGARLALNPRVQSINTNANASYGSGRLSEVVATIDREAVARHGISVQEATSLLAASVSNTAGGGRVVLDGESIPYQVKLVGYRAMDVGRLLETVATTPRGIAIPLGDIFTIAEREVLSTILREDQQYERTVAYEFRGPALLGNLVRDEAVAATTLPAGYSIRDRTIGAFSAEDEAQFRFVLLISIGLIFMVTAALYESIRQPLCILLAVPMALIGVFLTFFYAHITFTREAYIGVIMMGGVVVSNAILLVDHINRVRRDSGLPFVDAIVRGTLERVRPILMTTATTVLGLLPLVLFTPTVNATIWNALTYALIGGLLSSTLFVLTTIPALYLLFERGKAAKEERARGVGVSEDLEGSSFNASPAGGFSGNPFPEPSS